MRIEGEVEGHHAYAIFRWAFTEVSSGEMTTGIDFCEFGVDGLMSKIVVFFDLPPMSAHGRPQTDD